ncbi:major intrinsically disordered NOTCH2-binding receptor 1-like [Periophthalmus magnuspinnatus]|uniref:major intrinsically disordered NOTCH2-binding receptor 1-like n=1 Tax=Periophthalmus magnuspinnatus TaxID=409849 RepID=UPI0024369FFC|nr:major intrinsically disordered NOTCH2-binding receptor 1-like [Periophthalmus magnuspinnatus]
MDISALPNNNDPERFLQLDVGMLPATHGMFQLQAVMSSQRHWHNRVYNQMEGQRVRGEGQSRVPSPENSPVVFMDRYLEKHITPVTLKTTIKTNPLYMDFTEMEQVDNEKNKPSWTVQEYDTQTLHGNLADYLKEGEKTPKDLDFWLEELYTPGFDSLLRKKEAEEQQKKICKFLSLTLLSICVILIVILVPVMVLKKSN